MEQQSEGRLPVKQRLFCYYYLKLCNVREAAVKAGYFPLTALVDGMKLLAQKRVQQYLSELAQTVGTTRAEIIKAGLERIALGEVTDAVSLVCAEETPSQSEIAAMDLFSVAEIKRVKGGGVEIKFFDRQKALEKLWELEHTMQTTQTAQSFYNALQQGVSALERPDADAETAQAGGDGE